MGARPVQISIDAELLERMDADPEVKRRGRSAVVRDALRSYLRERDRARLDDRIRAAYGGKGGRMLREIEGLLGSQAWGASGSRR